MARFEPIPAETEELGRKLIGAAIEVHKALGPGFLEQIYEHALCHELVRRNIPFEQQKPIVVRYKGIEIPGQRLDLLVGGQIIVELKAVQAILPIHEAQLISYLKSVELRLGYIMNFNVRLLRDGIKRIVL